MQHKTQRKSLWSLALWKGCRKDHRHHPFSFLLTDCRFSLTPDLARELWKDANNFRVSEVGAGPEAASPDLQRRRGGGAVPCGECRNSWLDWQIILIWVSMIHAKNPISGRKWKKNTFSHLEKTDIILFPTKRTLVKTCKQVKTGLKTKNSEPCVVHLGLFCPSSWNTYSQKVLSPKFELLNCCFRVIASFLFWFLFVLMLYFMVLFYFILKRSYVVQAGLKLAM